MNLNHHYNSTGYIYTAGIRYDFAPREVENEDKIFNRVEYSYSAPPLGPFIRNDQTSDFPEELIKIHTENLPPQVRTILYGAWIDPNFKRARDHKLINLHHFTEIEFALIVEVAKMLNNKIPDTITGLLLMIMGRENEPQVVPIIWPESVKTMAPLEDTFNEYYGPYNVTSKILINLLSSTNPDRSLIIYSKYEFRKVDDVNYTCLKTISEEKFINPTELYKILKINREVPESPLSFDYAVNHEIELIHYSYKNCNWFRLHSNHFKMAWGDDVSLRYNTKHGPIPWVNICNDNIPPTLLLHSHRFPDVKWKSDESPQNSSICDFCPKRYPDKYKKNFLKLYLDEIQGIKMNISFWNGQEFVKPDGTITGKKRTSDDIFFASADENGTVPLANILGDPSDRIREFLCIVECTDSTCSDPSCPYKISKNLINPKVSMAYFPEKKWGVIAEESIQADKLLFIYNGDKFAENEKNYDDNYTFEYSIGRSTAVTIDATKNGNISRFINHSCFENSTRFTHPNCIAFKITSAPYDYRIAIFSSRNIYPGEELTLNYKAVMKKKECLCNSCVHKNHPIRE